MPDERDEPDLFDELRGFLESEEQLLASLGAALDELAALGARRLDPAERTELWRRIESRVTAGS